MKWQKFLSYFCYLFIPSFLLITGCSKPILKMPKSWPPIIRDYKYTTIFAGFEGMQATGIYLNKSDTFTILATGSMDLCPYGDCIYRDVGPEDHRRFKMKIGENHVFYPLWGNNIYTEATSIILIVSTTSVT